MSDSRLLGLNGAIKTSNITLGTTAAVLTATPLNARRSIYIFNNASAGGSTIYVGGSTVNSTIGVPIQAQSGLSINLSGTVQIYGYGSVAGVDVRIMEIA